MKKVLKPMATVVALTLLVGALLAGCGGSGDAIVGKWTATEVNVSGITMNLNDFAEQFDQEFDVTFDFKADGTFTGEAMGQTASGTWTNENGTYNVTIDGETQQMTLSDGKLSMTISGVTVIMTK